MVALFAQQSNIIELSHFKPTSYGKSDEWYTPLDIIKAARLVLGDIELDPASSHEANKIVQAKRYYSKEDDGLAQAWNARTCWLNPPYGRQNGSGKSIIRMFVTRLIEEYRAGNVKQAILLTTVQTNATWFQQLWEYPMCFTSRRVAFLKPINGKIAPDSRTSHTLGTALIYPGPHEQTFINTFSQFGRIAKAIDTPRQRVRPLSLWEEV